MNEALALSKSIAELGILIIIAGAFIYMVYQNWKIKNEKDKTESEQLNKLVQDIQAQNNDLVDKLISANRPQTITAEQYNNTSKIGNEINEALEKARLKTDASRACLVQFHNGRT